MKRFAMILATAALALVMGGCACSSNAASSASGASGDASASSAAASGEASASSEATVIQGENAWSEAKNSDAAGKDAGFSDGFELPNPLPIGDYKWSKPNFTAMDKVAEAAYDGGGVCAVVRKGEGVPLKELSSDTSDYKADWTQDCDGVKVTCHGYKDGSANFIEWENDGCSFNVWFGSTTGDNGVGMSEEEVAAMVAGVH